MKAVFLGTNGWFDSETGLTICVLIKTEEYDIVLDAGSGFFRLDQYIDGNKPVYLLLSHFHMDHTYGLHGLSKINCKKGLFIVGQEGTRRTIELLVNRPFTVPLADLRYRTEILELPSDAEKIPFGLESLPLVHADLCLGYRITTDGRTLAFCTDTGYCENAVSLARDADLLITECSFLPGEENRDWPHLNPETAARIAMEADARRLALVHFDASRYLTLEMRKIAGDIAKKIFPGTTAATDFLNIEL